MKNKLSLLALVAIAIIYPVSLHGYKKWKDGIISGGVGLLLAYTYP